MNYHRVNNRKGKKVAIIFGVIVLLFVLLTFTPLFSWLSKLFHGIGAPAWRGQALVEESVDGAFRTKKSLRKENAMLRAEVEKTKALELELEKVRTENDTLAGLLGRTSSRSPDSIAGRVLSKPPASLYDTLVIDIGTNDGVAVGNLVLGEGLIALGTVAESERGTSVVRLFSAPQPETDVMLNASHLSTRMKGRGGGSFTLEFPRDIEIIKDEPVIHIASNYLIGVVKEVDFDPRDPFQTVFVASPINLQSLQFVEVVK